MTTCRYMPGRVIWTRIARLSLAASIVTSLYAADAPKDRLVTFWQDPANLEHRDLFYGPGGKNDAPPAGPFQFLKEDLNGTNPKFTAKDANGTKWKVKLGAEARPETVATRLLWAVGYFADEDYFVPRAQLTDVPPKLRRLRGLISNDSIVTNVRFEREDKSEKKEERWSWKHNPFAASKEWNGLRVMMAVLNNWDLKDENNTVYRLKDGGGSSRIYVVSDLGATFGTPNLVRGHEKSRGNLDAYDRSRFIVRKTAETVDFATPGRPAWITLVNPPQYVRRVRLEWIGRNIPRADAKWVGTLLARLSPAQLRDAFRAAGYSPDDVARFAQVLERRIAELNAL
jgi:hypothetical protein